MSEIKKFLDLLKSATQSLAIPFQVQINMFPEFVVLTDELLLNFSNIYDLIPQILESGLISIKQIEYFKKINDYSIHLSVNCKEVFSNDALKNDPRWKKMRELAKQALDTMNWSKKSPDLSHLTYIGIKK